MKELTILLPTLPFSTLHDAVLYKHTVIVMQGIFMCLWTKFLADTPPFQ